MGPDEGVEGAGGKEKRRWIGGEMGAHPGVAQERDEGEK